MTTRPQAKQMIEIETASGRWERVPSDSAAATLYEMRRDTAALSQGMARVQAGIETVQKQQKELIPMTIEIRSFRELETASLAGVLTKGQAYRYIEKRAAELATKSGLSKSESIEQFCAKNQDIYVMYRGARDDGTPPQAAAPEARTMGTAELALDTKARAFAAANDVTYAVAMSTIAGQRENGDLYKRYLVEQRTQHGK